MEAPMSDYTALADRYIAVWNETDAERRQALIAQTWTETASYLDPMMAGEGHAGIDGLVRGVQTQFPDFRFHLIGTPNGYQDRLRFVWGLGVEGQPPVVIGTDFGVVAAD